MNRKLIVAGLMALSLNGCANMNNTERGALTGTALGAGLGTVIGGLAGGRGGAGIGAAAGALLGAGTGAAIGHSEDKAEQRAVAQAQAYAAANPPLSLTDVARLAQQHVPDSVIIQQMRTSNSVYQLQPDELIWLRQQGVSEPVILEMQQRRPGLVQVHPRPVRHVYVVDPPPPPIGIGFGISNAGPCGPRW